MTQSIDPPVVEAIPQTPRWLRGIFVRRTRWVLTWQAKLILLALVAGILAEFMWHIHSFLAPSEFVPSKILVIEGWSPPFTMRQAAAAFRSGHFQHIVLIRPVLDQGDKYESGRYSGDWVTQVLIGDGVAHQDIDTLFPMVAHKDRTYHSALVVKQWLADHFPTRSLDVATLGPHARRSRLLYQKAFGDDFTIGIIPLDNPEYDPAHWWRTSEGVREVIGESIAYLYARFLFHPTGS